MTKNTNKINNKNRAENNKGVTLIALVVTVIVLSIIAGISIHAGKGTIKKAKLEEYRTNMLLIKGKAKEYYEELEFKIGPYPLIGEEGEAKRNNVADEVLRKNHKLELIVNNPAYIRKETGDMLYKITDEGFEQMGLDFKKEEGETYYIKINLGTKTLEIYNSIGFDGKHSLTEIENYDVKLQGK